MWIKDSLFISLTNLCVKNANHNINTISYYKIIRNKQKLFFILFSSFLFSFSILLNSNNHFILHIHSFIINHQLVVVANVFGFPTDELKKQQQDEQEVIETENSNQLKHLQGEQTSRVTSITQRLSEKAVQLGISTDVAQQLAQKISQIKLGEKVKMQIQQKAVQLGIDVEIAQQLAQEISQIKIGKKIGQTFVQKALKLGVDAETAPIFNMSEVIIGDDEEDVTDIIFSTAIHSDVSEEIGEQLAQQARQISIGDIQ